MRMLLALPLILASPAHAWEAFVEDGLCVLQDSSPGVEARLTYDPAGPLYTIALTTPAPWPAGPVFSIRFEGAEGLTISTDRHMLDQGDRRLSVSDRGFGNVLAGLEAEGAAIAMIGTASVAIPLQNAAPAVRAFRACTTNPVA